MEQGRDLVSLSGGVSRCCAVLYFYLVLYEPPNASILLLQLLKACLSTPVLGHKFSNTKTQLSELFIHLLQQSLAA